MPSQKEIQARLFDALSLLFAFLIPISSYASIRIELVLFVLALLVLKARVLRAIAFFFDAYLYLLVLIIGLLYSADLTAGWRVLETHFSLFAIPIIFYAGIALRTVKFDRLLKSFVLGVLVSTGTLITHATIVYFQTGDPTSFLYYNLTSFLGFQPTYFAFYLVLSLTAGLQFLRDCSNKTPTFLVGFMLALFFVTLILTGGRTTFIALLLVVSYYLLSFITAEQQSRSMPVFVAALLMLLGLFIVPVYEQQLPGFLYHDGWERYQLWGAALSAIPDFLWGAGTGDVVVTLNRFYREVGLVDFANSSMNSHNQYLHIMLAVGVFGVLFFLIMLIRPLYLFLQIRNPSLILYFYPFLIYGTMEVFLGRYQGVVFFACVYSFVLCFADYRRRELGWHHSRASEI